MIISNCFVADYQSLLISVFHEMLQHNVTNGML